jgi:uncharacterized protein YdeI (YjbR/CyaY-like superfamily)
MAATSDSPTFFATPAKWRAWLERHAATRTELSVGFYKKGSGKPSITWPEAVDEALCFGWIDGVRHRIDDERYRIRFTPRRRGSIWSDVNVRRVGELIAEGRMTPAGLAAFEARTAARSGVYAYETRAEALPHEMERELRANAAAWEHFSQRPPSYRRSAIAWVTGAKQAVTRERRLASLIDHCARGATLPQYIPRR